MHKLQLDYDGVPLVNRGIYIGEDADRPLTPEELAEEQFWMHNPYEEDYSNFLD